MPLPIITFPLAFCLKPPRARPDDTPVVTCHYQSLSLAPSSQGKNKRRPAGRAGKRTSGVEGCVDGGVAATGGEGCRSLLPPHLRCCRTSRRTSRHQEGGAMRLRCRCPGALSFPLPSLLQRGRVEAVWAAEGAAEAAVDDAGEMALPSPGDMQVPFPRELYHEPLRRLASF